MPYLPQEERIIDHKPEGGAILPFFLPRQQLRHLTSIILIDGGYKAEGQITFSAYRVNEIGRVSNLQKKHIQLDLIVPDDEVILAQRGLTALRQARILRLAHRAAEQGAVLTYENLVHLLCTSLSTLKRDIRILQRMGLSVPIHRRRGRRAGILFLPILIVFLWSTEGQAQLSSIFGTVGFDYQYETQSSEGTSASRQLFLHQYNIGVDGRILDPRLALFSLSGAFSSSFLSEDSSRASSFSGILSLLQQAPYGLTLRAGRSLSAGGSDTESNTVGANLRITRPEWPQLYIDFDRVTIESHGDSHADNSITTGKVRVSHRFRSTMLDGEIGVQSFADRIGDSSQDRYFARLHNTVTWSPTTTLRSVNDAFLQGNQLGLSSSYFLENRPDPTLSRTVGISYRSDKAGDQTDHSLDLTSAISKTLIPYSWLQTNFFTSAIARKRFGADGNAGVAWSGGTSSTMSYFRPVSLLADYALAVSYESDIAQPGTTQQLHFGAISQTLQPLRLSGDYFVAFQTGETHGARHFVAGKADAALTPQLAIRSFADFLAEDIQSETVISNRRVATLGAGVSYRPLLNLAFDFAGDIQRTDAPDNSGITTRANLRATYLLPARGNPTLDINAIWERATATEENRLEITSRLSYRLGQTTMMFEHRIQRRQALASTGITNSIHFNLSRPFRFGF